MLNGTGQRYHCYNFLVGLHFYTTNTICLCHESYFNIINLQQSHSKSLMHLKTGWLINHSHRLVLWHFYGSCAEGCNKTKNANLFYFYFSFLAVVQATLHHYWRKVVR